MDLFEDLPEPETNTCATASTLYKEAESVNSFKRKNEGCHSPDKKVNKGYQYVLRGFSAEIKGEREDMQDAQVILDDYSVANLHNSINRLSYYAVFDGHGGARASKYAAENMHKILEARFPRGDFRHVEGDIKRCLIDTFKKTDDDFLKEASKNKPAWKDGSTAVTVLVINDILYVANIGDSRAVLCRFNEESNCCKPIPLTKDHSPTAYDERQRIQKAGGQVRDGRVMGVLEVSRSIGDGQFKRCGVICTPDVARCQITNNDRFILVACDGVWKVLSPAEAVQYTMQQIEKFKDLSANEMYAKASRNLAAEAVRRQSGDNVTVVLISIQNQNQFKHTELSTDHQSS